MTSTTPRPRFNFSNMRKEDDIIGGVGSGGGTFSPAEGLPSAQISMASSTRTPRPLDICIYLRDHEGCHMTLDSGRLTTTAELSTLMAEHLSIQTAKANRIFSLWLCSPHLELQLKPNHQPFRLRKQWPDLLDRYTTCTEEQMERDEPILYYQRNAFYHKEDEKKLDDERILECLFIEAKHNFLLGRYPCSEEDAFTLGAFLVRIINGACDTTHHNVNILKNSLTEYLPVCYCKKKWTLLGKQTEQKLFEKFKDLHVDDVEPIMASLYKQFLTICWKFPFYGAVYFQGQIEKPSAGVKLRDNPDRTIHVAINRNGITLIDVLKSEILLSLKYDELSWEYTSPTSQRPGCLPCLWLEFDMEQSDGSVLNKILQVFSKQAAMMNAMIEASIEELNKRDSDLEVDFGAHEPQESKSLGSDSETNRTKAFICKRDSLCLSTYCEGGKLVPNPPKSQFSIRNSLRALSTKRSTTPPAHQSL